MEKGWTIAYEVEQPYQAELAKEILNEANIPCIILNKKGDTFPSIGTIEIYVETKNQKIANELLTRQLT